MTVPNAKLACRLRRRLIAAAAALVLALPFGMAVSGPVDAAARGPADIADLAGELLDSVVNISTSQTVQGSPGIPMPEVPPGSPFEDFFEEFFERNQQNNRPRRVNSLGSGFVIDPDGIIVTNNHVIADADEIEVNFPDGRALSAEVIGRDPKTDIAVLRVEPDEPLKAVAFGDSEALRIGEWVMAIGNPFGLGSSVSAGIVSAVKRDINAGPYDSFIQTDAAINRGKSGGPLFNLDGEVIGINTAIISPSGGSIGIGFAIPADLAIGVVQQLIDFGETRRGWLGVTIQNVTDEIADSLGLASASGALVAGVRPDSPAGEAGFEPGDVIIAFDGQEIEDTRDLSRTVADTPVEAEVDVVIIRDGEELTLPVTIGLLAENEEQPRVGVADDDDTGSPALTALGLDLGEYTDDLRSLYNIDHDVEGVVITEVAPDSPAAERQISAGDIIAEVAQEKVSTPGELISEIEDLRETDRQNALFLIVNPAGDHRFVVLPLDAVE